MGRTLTLVPAIFVAIWAQCSVAGDVAPKSSEIVAVLFGKTYTFADVGPSKAVVDTFRREALETVLLTPRGLRQIATANFHDLALPTIIAQDLPKCDFSVSSAEVRDFVDWWKAGVEKDYPAYLAFVESQPVNVLALAGKPLEQLTTSNGDAIRVAKHYIVEWKQNACLYRAFGGRVERHSFGNILFLTEGGFLYPHYEFGFPADARLREYANAMSTGELKFPDARYKHLFFQVCPDCSVAPSYYLGSNSARMVLRPFWSRR
jgi:hypothetical protein